MAPATAQRLREGSLFTGYNGLGLATEAVLNTEPVWFCEYEPPTEKNPRPHDAAAKILKHRYSHIPNLGDVTAVDWSTVEPVDVLTAGFPCQDVSDAGGRAGMRPGNRSGLWSHVAYAISQLRPPLVIIENVRGLLSAEAHCEMEPCPWCVGDGDGVPALRALGAVLGNLADLGYDARWCGLRAADVGAPHGRFRVFVVAWPATDPGSETSPVGSRQHEGESATVGHRRPDHGHQPAAADPAEPERHRPQLDRVGTASTRATELGERVGVAADADGETGRPEAWGAVTGPSGGPDDSRPAEPRRRGTPATDPTSDGRHQGRPEPERVVGGPDAPERGPAADPNSTRREGSESEPGWWPGSPDSAAADPIGVGRVRGSRQPVGGPLGRTPAAGSGEGDRGRPAEAAVHWGPYEPAIRRWERTLGRPAPAPTDGTGRDGAQRLSPRFVEWMQGLDDGWVTDVPGITRNDMLHALGNGVVPQQGAAAIRWLLGAP